MSVSNPIHTIWQLSLRDPLVRQAVTDWQRGQYQTWEDAMMHLVLALAEQNETLKAQAAKELTEQKILYVQKT